MLEIILTFIFSIIIISMAVYVLIQVGKFAFSILDFIWSVICAAAFYIGGIFVVAFMIIKLPFTLMKKLITR